VGGATLWRSFAFSPRTGVIVALLGAICIVFFLAAAAALLSFEGESPRRPLRETLLIAAAVWGAWLMLGTELLSLVDALRWGPVSLWWLIPTAGLAALAARDRRWVGRLRADCASMRRPGWLNAAFIAAVGLVLVTTAVIAAVTPPNNWDSMTYHMPRQVHWMQQASVAHYATPEIRQVVMPPMAEFAGLHLMILSGGDLWANLVQWFALAMTALTASLIARELGARARGQSLAALLVVTNPMAAMQAVNTKNDLVLALWACAMAYFVLRVWTARRCPADRAALIGLTLGLMVATKGTGLIVGLPISLVAAVAILSAQRWRGLLTGAAIGVIALAMSAGHFSRNMQDFGSPTTPSKGVPGLSLANETFTPVAIASNTIRNVSLHAGTPWDRVNAASESAIERLHNWMGIAATDSRTTYLGLNFAVVRRNLSEDVAPTPVHMALALTVVPVLLVLQRRNRVLLVAALISYTTFLLFCIVLKWQPWHARLHLPIVCLFAPIAATALAEVWRGTLAAATAGLAMFVVAPSILWGEQKPLLGSPSIFTATWEENLFRTRTDLIEPLREAVDVIKRIEPRTMAILRVDNQWSYPFQRALLREMDRPPTFVSLGKHQAQRREYEFDAPDLVLHTDGRALWMGAQGTRYVAGAHAGQHTVYVPREVAQQWGLAPAPPAFIGWNNTQGLGALEGPYPQWDLPQVRWGLGPATMLRFASDGEAATLILEARQRGRFGQTIVVQLNGQEVGRHEFGEAFAFEEVRIPLALRRGINELLIEYNEWAAAGGRPIAVLYRRLQILPGEHSVEEGAGDPGP
jgi:hypothetical protein